MDRLSATSPLVERLLAPHLRLRWAEVADAWSAVCIEATMPGYGPLAGELDLLRKLRGAVGAVLLRSASREAQSGRPCPWQPPCALDILFREQARLPGGRGIPKPWALAADRVGQDLRLRLTLFGFAGDWAPAVAAALAEATVHGVAWDRLRPDLFRPRPAVAALEVSVSVCRPVTPMPTAVAIEFRTPLEAEATDLRDAPWTFIGRAARRIALLGRWMDTDLDDAVAAAAAGARQAAYATSGLRLHAVDRRSGRASKDFAQPMHAGEMVISDAPEEVWHILRLAEACHVGRGATMGFGRIILGTVRDFVCSRS